MNRPRKNPARPKARPAPERKKRRRARFVGRSKRQVLAGDHAVLKYRFGAGYFSIGDRRAESFATTQSGGASPRRLRALGRGVLKPFAAKCVATPARKRAAKDRRLEAILAQAARRAGRFNMQGADFGSRPKRTRHPRKTGKYV